MDTKKYFITFGLALLSSNAFAQDKLSTLTWGLSNEGSAQQIAIDHYTSGSLLGVTGEDIRVPAPAAGARKVIVGVLDTGVDYTHPQLKNILAGRGYNAINNTFDATDTHGHGTHVSGVIAAELNESGFQGVSKNARILPVKVVQTGPNAPIRPQDTEPGVGTALTETVAKGLVWAIQNGAEVINLSMAWPISIHSKKVDDAIELARQKNVIIVSSAGNDGTSANVYPCIYENVICVGSHGPDGFMSHFSNFGSMVDILAPGTAILSTWPLNKLPVTFAGQVGYEFRNGTSMSAPFVTGAAAELLSRGLSPDEVRSRLLLGSRKTADHPSFSSVIVGQYTQNKSTETKSLRFGNLDITQALAINPSPLILPVKKGVIEIEWDGISDTLNVPIEWKNRWISADTTEISVNSQNFSFNSVGSQEKVTTTIQIVLGKNQDSTIHLKASVKTALYQKDEIEITIQLVRMLRSDLIPSEAKVQTIEGLNPRNYSSIRTVVNSDQKSRADLAFVRSSTNGLELALVQKNTFLASATLAGFSSDQLLNVYRLPDQTYTAIFTKPDKDVTRPNFYIERFDTQMKFISEARLGTDTTVLSENFQWMPFKGGFIPLWISIGYTPTLDKPKYDPWNPTYQDSKLPRLFYLDGNNLRMVTLSKNQNPLQILNDGRILISEGLTYFQKYTVITLKDGVISQSEPVQTPNYRMLIGLDTGVQALSLSDGSASSLLMTGSSSPGNLRVTAIGNSNFDQILARSTILDALVSVLAGFTDSSNQYYFVQTHYDLQFFKSGSDQTLSTSLNRYSYIPSMIFTRSFFPTLVKDANGAGLPAVYIPALALANSNISEVVVADSTNEQITRPARLRFRVKDPSCLGMGNLIAATASEPAKQVFICGNQLIQVPLAINP